MARKHSIVIPPELHDFLIGSRLGDACFIQKTEKHNCYVVFSQCASQLEYLKWKYDFLQGYGAINDGNVIKKMRAETRYCYPNAQDQYRFMTKSCPEFNQYKQKSKIDLINEIDELGLVIYLLDDGSFNSRCGKISCGTLNDEERAAVCDAFYRVAGIQATIYKHPTNRHKDYFCLTARYYDTLQAMATKHIPSNIDVMMHKFGGARRDHKSKVS